jgi:flagellar hook-basal body complex protein FliE
MSDNASSSTVELKHTLPLLGETDLEIPSESSASGSYTSETTIGSIGELQEKAPKVYEAMLMGIAQNICSEMQHAQVRLKEMMREANSY